MTANHTSISDLPPELQLLIFDQLDFCSRLECSLVCKDWNRLAMSGAFLNKRVLMKTCVFCYSGEYTSPRAKARTARYIGSVLLQSSRNYKALSIHYHDGTVAGVNSMLAVFKKFHDLTFLHFELRHQVTHVHFIEQILQFCPALRSLHLSINLVTGKNLPVQRIDNQLTELTLSCVCLIDFRHLIRMFDNVSSLTLQTSRVTAEHVQWLVERMPLLQELHLLGVHIFGSHPMRHLKRLQCLRELSIVDCLFARDFTKWPKLPRSIRFVTLQRCLNVVMVDQMLDRWRHVERLAIAANNDYFLIHNRYFF